MNCNHVWRMSYKSYKDNKHISTTYFCSGCKKFKEEDGSYDEISGKKLDETDRRLNQTVREGITHCKDINNLRSEYKNGKWQYKYIK